MIDADTLKRKSTGLEDALGALKKKKLSSMAKSHIDWQQYKATTVGLDDELRNANKAGFLDEQAFLERADWRQFEVEKSVLFMKLQARSSGVASKNLSMLVWTSQSLKLSDP